MAAKKNSVAAKVAPELNLNEDQQRVAEALVFSGVGFERDRLTKILSPYRGKAINVDTMIEIINNIKPSEEESS